VNTLAIQSSRYFQPTDLAEDPRVQNGNSRESDARHLDKANCETVAALLAAETLGQFAQIH